MHIARLAVPAFTKMQPIPPNWRLFSFSCTKTHDPTGMEGSTTYSV